MPTGIGICLFLISSAIELIYRPAALMFSTAASALPTLPSASCDQFSDASTFSASSDEETLFVDDPAHSTPVIETSSSSNVHFFSILYCRFNARTRNK